MHIKALRGGNEIWCMSLAIDRPISIWINADILTGEDLRNLNSSLDCRRCDIVTKKKALDLVILLFLSCLGLVAAVRSKDGSDYHSAHSVSFGPAYAQEANFGIDRSMSVEMVISRRMSIRRYDLSVDVPWESVSRVIWAAHGYSWWGRTVPSLSGYPIIIYVCNSTATYRSVPEDRNLTLWKEGDCTGLGGGYDAPIQLYIVLDTGICPHLWWGNAESGCTIQNVYLMANALDLGTVCQYRNRTEIHQGLGLPANEKVLYKMPLGYPLPPYSEYENLVPTHRPSSPELPQIQDSNASLEDALNSVSSSREWSRNPITNQELSQVLWASYGYSYYEDTAESPPEKHRTVPSAHAYYPMKVYAANSSGVYEYVPEQHTLTTILTGDRRQSIAQASGNAWASSAPLMIAVAHVEDSRPWIGGEETYVEVGLMAQNVHLECAAWGLIADWGKADADEEAMREALGLTGETHLHPVSIITVGHPSTYQHKVLSNGMTYTVSFFTNSCITNFGDEAISFDLTSSADTVGFSNVTIPKEMLYGAFTVLIDGTPAEHALSENATHTSLYFTYSHTAQRVRIVVTPTAVIPTAHFTYSPIDPLVDETVTFNATLSTPNGGEIINYTWDFGDGFHGEGMITNHDYSETGAHNVTLTVIDSEGLNHTTWETVAVVSGTVNVIPELTSILLVLVVLLATTIVAITIRRRLSEKSAETFDT